MNINYDKIVEIYGEEYLNLIKENLEDIINNILYFKQLGFNDTEDIFERMTPLFITDNNTFKNKIDKLITKLGNIYVELIENDLSLLEELI